MSKQGRSPMRLIEDPGLEALRDLDVTSAPARPHPVDVIPPPAPRSAPAGPMADPPVTDLIEAGKGTTVHLTKHSAKVLKTLAAQEDTTVQALMIEGINLVFKKHGLPEIAAVGVRPDAARKKAAKQDSTKAS